MTEKLSSDFNFKIVLLFIPVAFFSYLFHECGHWIIGEILGNDMAYSLNGVWPKEGVFKSETHSLYVGIGGPAFSILQSIIFLIILEKSGSKYAYPFIFFPLYSRFFSLVFGNFSAQDEAGISASLNLGTYTIAIFVLLMMIVLVWRGSYKLRYGFKEIMISFLMSTFSKLLVIGTYELFK